MLVAALSCVQKLTPPAATEPTAAMLVLRAVRERFPRSRGWFRQVSGVQHHTQAGALVPDWETLRSSRVIRVDSAGQRLAPRMPLHADETMEIALEGRPGFWVRTTPLDATPAAVEAVDGMVVYPGAFPGGDLFYKVTPTRIDEYVYVAEPTGPHVFRYRIERGPEVAELRATSSGIEVFSADGVPRLRVGNPFARAADGARRDGHLTLEGDMLTIDVDLAGLAFPVLIDPDWSTTGRMVRERFSTPGFTLANGEVIMASGCTLALCPAGLGMPGCSEVLNGTERWNPETGTWRIVASVAVRRFAYAGGRLPDGRVLISGGCTERGCPTFTDSTEIYDPTADRWSGGPARATATAFPGFLTLADGRIFVSGGCNQTECTAITEIYDQATGAWRRAAPMARPRGMHTTALLRDGRVLVTGGCDALNCVAPRADAEVYDPVLDFWSPAGTMVSPRATHTATTLASGAVLIAGGCSNITCNPTLNSAEVWDPLANRFFVTDPMRVPRHDFRAARLANNTVIVMGGCGPTAACTRTTEVFDQAVGRWSAGPDMSAERGFFTGATMQDGREIVIGGCNSDTCIPWTELLSQPPPVASDAGDGAVDAASVDAGPTDVGPQDVMQDVRRPRDASTGYVRPACGCRTPGRRGQGGSYWLAVLAVVTIAARRRAARRPPICRFATVFPPNWGQESSVSCRRECGCEACWPKHVASGHAGCTPAPRDPPRASRTMTTVAPTPFHTLRP